MNWRSTAACTSMLIAISCNQLNAQTVISGDYPKASKISFDELKKAASSAFKDPSSAQFKLLKYHDNVVTGPVICGWVNAKNSLGGYGDFFPFYYQKTDGRLVVGEDYDNDVLGDLPRIPFVNVGCAINTLGTP